MSSFALYRLPGQQQAVLMEQSAGEPKEMDNCKALDGSSGFVIAPFEPTPQHPILLIHPDRTTPFRFDDEEERGECQKAGNEAPAAPTTGHRPPSSDYSLDFNRFHDCLVEGNFQKIVLSRCEELPRCDGDEPLQLFRRACRLYPRLFVALVHTPKSGTWLTATPEVLLNSDGQRWRTIALAGTQRDQGQDTLIWSEKDREEQRLVAAYIRERLAQLATEIDEEGPRTVSAANLHHLRTDFTFSIADKTRVGSLLQALHPTPAVCGLPKERAYQFICANEHTPRLYYSGFMGPIGLPTAGTQLFVSLRCMQITPTHYRLYAGGGLLTESSEQQEWMETEAKMDTMRRCLSPCSPPSQPRP